MVFCTVLCCRIGSTTPLRRPISAIDVDGDQNGRNSFLCLLSRAGRVSRWEKKRNTTAVMRGIKKRIPLLATQLGAAAAPAPAAGPQNEFVSCHVELWHVPGSFLVASPQGTGIHRPPTRLHFFKKHSPKPPPARGCTRNR